MNLPQPEQIAKVGRSLKLAKQCVRSVLRVNYKHPDLLPNERRAELEALCVVLSRAESSVWGKYPKEGKGR